MNNIAVAFIILALLFLSLLPAFAQITADEFVTYERKSAFIQEFPIPMEERGLRGVTIDSEGNPWVYYSTNTTSTILKFDVESEKFLQYPVEGQTAADEAVINLAAAHLIFDEGRNAIWFTDARINAVGRLQLETGGIFTVPLQTPNAGPMGIAMSPDSNSVWFTEITGDKIASIDAESMEITEYPTGEDSGPALLTFDNNGILWASLSFSRTVLRLDTEVLPSSSAMTEFKLAGNDSFSPFGLAVSNGKIYVSDHGSSRVIASDLGFAKYASYWTSPATEFQTTLPGEVVVDDQGNIYFPQHGGNRISAIDIKGVMAEYEIPTGPLSTVLFIAASDDGKVWFTEWAANKISYLDTSKIVPLDIQASTSDIVLTNDEIERIDISLNASAINPSVSLSEIDMTVIGMTESGLRGVTYASDPQRINIEEQHEANVKISLHAGQGAIAGKYDIMVRATAAESDGLLVSKLYPVSLTLDVPTSSDQTQQTTAVSEASDPLRDGVRIAGISAAVAIVAYLIYRRTRKKQSKAH